MIRSDRADFFHGRINVKKVPYVAVKNRRNIVVLYVSINNTTTYIAHLKRKSWESSHACGISPDLPALLVSHNLSMEAATGLVLAGAASGVTNPVS